MLKRNQQDNVVVIDGGNAALCAAMTAARTGARVLISEHVPKAYRWGNSRHTRNFFCMHGGPQALDRELFGRGIIRRPDEGHRRQN